MPKGRMGTIYRIERAKIGKKGSVAEWSKALALGASPKGRGFEPHHYHTFCTFKLVIKILQLDLKITSLPHLNGIKHLVNLGILQSLFHLYRAFLFDNRL